MFLPHPVTLSNIRAIFSDSIRATCTDIVHYLCHIQRHCTIFVPRSVTVQHWFHSQWHCTVFVPHSMTLYNILAIC